MDNPLIDRVVNAVLYEGYLLYPYRQSLKNIKRFSIGSLYPRSSPEVKGDAERWQSRARCLFMADEQAMLSIEVRFLHLIERSTPGGDANAWTNWHECAERRVSFADGAPQNLLSTPCRWTFHFPAAQWKDSFDSPTAKASGVVRRQAAVHGSAEVGVRATPSGALLLSIILSNETPHGPDFAAARSDSALMQSLVSAHVMLRLRGGQFLSRIDPPEEHRDALESDAADGLWPVLVGEEGQAGTMLCSPIILYDYPQIAAESPGDFFDATEIDEMLALRIMTLTDQEQEAMAALDDRGRALLDRTRNLAEQQLSRLHGAMRSRQPVLERSDGK